MSACLYPEHGWASWNNPALLYYNVKIRTYTRTWMRRSTSWVTSSRLLTRLRKTSIQEFLTITLLGDFSAFPNQVVTMPRSYTTYTIHTILEFKHTSHIKYLHLPLKILRSFFCVWVHWQETTYPRVRDKRAGKPSRYEHPKCKRCQAQGPGTISLGPGNNLNHGDQISISNLIAFEFKFCEWALFPLCTPPP